MKVPSATRQNGRGASSRTSSQASRPSPELPAGWSRKALCELLEEIDERANAAPEHYGLAVFSLTKRRGLIPQTERFTHRVATEDISKYKVVRKGQIVYNPYVIWEGAVHALRGVDAALVSPVYVVWSTRERDGGYLDFLLRTPEVVASYQRLSSGAVNRRRSIRREGFLGIEIAVPPAEERRAVAEALEAARGAKEACERIIVATRQVQTSLLKHLFAFGPVPVEEADAVILKETEIGPIPNHWEVARLGELADMVSGGTPSKAKEEFWSGPIPWISPKDLKHSRLYDAEDHISEDAVEEGSRLAPAKTLFLVVRGMILARDIPVALGMLPMAFNQDLKGIVARDRVRPDYLLYALMQHRQQLAAEIGTSAHGTRRIGSSAVENLLIPVPPPEEQDTIASILEVAESKLTREQARHQSLEHTYASLLRELTTGARRLPEFANGS